ncbi:MAG: branched-chain amino acid aminotransferase [Eubacteriaceae bacterium]|nr:branched-chain amino acid aminotransferase [Eubacteriaceae bacterium]MBR2781270.1 branched-chain amino acid aminotransferase [Eubacteriaceae bacterium]
MEKIDFENLGFGYHETPYRYVCEYKDGKWGEGRLTEDPNVVLNECACVFQYAQTCFEGMKAYKQVDGKAVIFRPELNAARMADTCERLMMPPFDKEEFVKACKAVSKANIDYIPPYGTGGSLYLRPYMIGSDPVLGVKPATEYMFRIFGSPVGAYFKGGIVPTQLKISDYDRAAPNGTGHVKAGLNYAMSLYPVMQAHAEGFDENVYLDPQSRTYIEETGGSNIFFITKDGELVTPKSNSILPSITRRSILYVAEHYLNMKVTERKIALTELDDFAEAGLCGTAAVISPVGMISDHGRKIVYGDTVGPITKKLYDTLVGIQLGTIEAPEGWIVNVEE